MSTFTGTFKNINSCRRNIEGCKGSNMKVNKYGLKLSTVQQMRRLLGHRGTCDLGEHARLFKFTVCPIED